MSSSADLQQEFLDLLADSSGDHRPEMLALRGPVPSTSPCESLREQAPLSRTPPCTPSHLATRGLVSLREPLASAGGWHHSGTPSSRPQCGCLCGATQGSLQSLCCWPYGVDCSWPVSCSSNRLSPLCYSVCLRPGSCPPQHREARQAPGCYNPLPIQQCGGCRWNAGGGGLGGRCWGKVRHMRPAHCPHEGQVCTAGLVRSSQPGGTVEGKASIPGLGLEGQGLSLSAGPQAPTCAHS